MEQRFHRLDPRRTQPLRKMSGLFREPAGDGVSRGQPQWTNGYSSQQAPQDPSWLNGTRPPSSSYVAEGERAAYQVIDEYLAEGYTMARMFNPHASDRIYWSSGSNPGAAYCYPGGGAFGPFYPPMYDGPLERMARMFVSVMECIGAVYGYGRPQTYPWPRSHPYSGAWQGGPAPGQYGPAPQKPYAAAPSVRIITNIDTSRHVSITIRLFAVDNFARFNFTKTFKLQREGGSESLSMSLKVENCTGTLEAKIDPGLPPGKYSGELKDDYGNPIVQLEMNIQGRAPQEVKIEVEPA